VAHCTMLQAGEIQAIVGDDARNSVAGPQYSGVWSLTSTHRAFNAFGNSYAGLLPGLIRQRKPALECIDDTCCALVRHGDDDYPVDVQATYKVQAPYYVDHAVTFSDRRDMRSAGCSFREVSWCCYMNCPEDSRLNFLSNGEWFRYMSPRHGIGSNIAPSYVDDADLEVWPERREVVGNMKDSRWKEPFHWDRIERRFDKPFYYGRLGHMVMILIFDTSRWLRFYCSPSGGGPSLRAGETCPAWDFEWVIPSADYAPSREYEFRARLVYKVFESDEDVLKEYRQAREDLGFA